MEDHVHLLARFGRKITQADWVKEVKRVSNVWLKKLGEFDEFQWQGGYAAFSVSASNLDQVKSEVRLTLVHHQTLAGEFPVEDLGAFFRSQCSLDILLATRRA